MLLSVAGAAFVAYWLARRHWIYHNSNDLGSMSKRWLAEYNARHP